MSDVIFDQDQYVLRRKLFAFLGKKFYIFDANENLVGFVKQKAFKLKEDGKIILIQLLIWGIFATAFSLMGSWGPTSLLPMVSVCLVVYITFYSLQLMLMKHSFYGAILFKLIGVTGTILVNNWKYYEDTDIYGTASMALYDLLYMS